jgi:hypothetical protein
MRTVRVFRVPSRRIERTSLRIPPAKCTGSLQPQHRQFAPESDTDRAELRTDEENLPRAAVELPRKFSISQATTRTGKEHQAHQNCSGTTTTSLLPQRRGPSPKSATERAELHTRARLCTQTRLIRQRPLSPNRGGCSARQCTAVIVKRRDMRRARCRMRQGDLRNETKLAHYRRR